MTKTKIPGERQASFLPSRQSSAFSLFAAGFLAALAMIPAAAQAQTITTVAGGGPNNLPALSNSFGGPYGFPTSVVADASGNLFVVAEDPFVDGLDSRVFKVSSSGQLTVVAGDGVTNETGQTDSFIGNGDGGPATAADIGQFSSVAIDSAGNIYIADTVNNRIREVVAATGIIQTVAGTDDYGDFVGAGGFSGDGGPATFADLNGPSGVFVDGVGNIFIADLGNQRIREVVAATGNIQTVAGNGNQGFSGDGGPATSAELNGPSGVFVDGAGNIFVEDTDNSSIREVVAATGNIQTVAGNGIPGFSGDGGPATSAELALLSGIDLQPTSGIVVDSAGNIFIADTFNNRIREVVAGTGIIQTVAGSGEGNGSFSGDGGPATSAGLDNPSGIFLDSSGNIFIADSGNSRIREVAAATGIIQTVAGGGAGLGDGGPATDAGLSGPDRIFADGAGNIFIADADNSRVREVVAATGNIQTVAGTGFETAGVGDGGPAISADIGPSGVFVDGSGNIFITDLLNNTIREVLAASGIIQTVAGNVNLSAGFSGDGGPATSAELSLISSSGVNASGGVFVDSAGNIFIADTGNNRIREVVAATGNIQTVAGGGTAGLGDGGPATSAQLVAPEGVSVDAAGNILIADTNNFRVREVPATTGIIQTVAGNGLQGFVQDGVSATSTDFGPIPSVAVDAAGNIFIPADGAGSLSTDGASGAYGTDAIVEVVAATGNTKIVAGIAINGLTLGLVGFAGDGGPATCAPLNEPGGVVVDGAGDLFIADTLNNRIRKVVPSAPEPCAFLLPRSLAFQSQAVGTTSTSQPDIQLANTGATTLDITGISISGANAGDFSRTSNDSGDCGTSLAPGKSCFITFAFTPTAPGARTAFISIADNVGGSPQIVPLTGLGAGSVTLAPGAAFSPTSLTFTSQTVGTNSAAQGITLTNSGNASLSITGITLTGTNPGDYSETNTCGATLAATSNCTISVTFKPTAAGTRTASVSVADNASGSPQTVGLTGTGAAVATAPSVTLAPNSLTFSSQTVGVSSAVQTVTLTNSGNASLSITGITITGTDAGDYSQTNTCGTSVAASASCSISVTFTPTASGTRTASVSIADNASGSPQSVSLTGTGAAAAVGNFSVAASPASLTVTAGSSGTSTLTVTPTNGFNQAVTFACSGLPSQAACSFAPATVTPNGAAASTTLTISTAATTTTGMNREPARPASGTPLTLALAGVFAGLFSLGGIRRKGVRLLSALMMLTALGLLAGCGGSSSKKTVSGTPTGTYTVTVTAAFGSGSSALSQTAAVTLIVQ